MMIEGYTDDQIGYHAYLIVDDGLANGADITHSGCKSTMYHLTKPTSAGHDFAESARMPFIWNEVMASAKEKGVGSTSVDIIKHMLDKALKKRLDVDE